MLSQRHPKVDMDVMSSSRFVVAFNCLTFTFFHFFGESLFAMLADIADASRAVGLEQEIEYLSDRIGILSVSLDILHSLYNRRVTLCSFYSPGNNAQKPCLLN